MYRVTLQHTVQHICSHSRQTFPQLEITSTSEGRNLKNLATSTTTERNIPEAICKVCLAGGRDHRQKPSEVFLINEARPGQASESDSGPIHCKHSLMEGSNPGTHMNGWRQTHTYERFNVHTPGHTGTCTKVEEHALSSLSLHSLLPTLMQTSSAVWKCRFPTCVWLTHKEQCREIALITKQGMISRLSLLLRSYITIFFAYETHNPDYHLLSC